jgi:hypothetical protein
MSKFGYQWMYEIHTIIYKNGCFVLTKSVSGQITMTIQVADYNYTTAKILE